MPPGTRVGKLAAVVNFLELPTVRQMVSLVSVEEYHRMPEYNARGIRTELIRGIVIEKVGKTPLQCYLLNRLRRMVTDAVGYACGSHSQCTTLSRNRISAWWMAKWRIFVTLTPRPHC